MPLENLLGPVGDMYCFSNTYRMLVFSNVMHLALMYLGVRQFLTSSILNDILTLQSPRGHPCRIDTFLVNL